MLQKQFFFILQFKKQLHSVISGCYKQLRYSFPVTVSTVNPQTAEAFVVNAFNTDPAQQVNPNQTAQQDNPINVGLGTAGAIAVVGIAIAALVLPPNLEAVPQGQAPLNQPQPGTLGGGGQPIGSNPISLEALSLTPLGLVPVAIFPPWLTPRTFPAVAVIFSENSGTPAGPSSFLSRRLSSETFSTLTRFTRRRYRSKPRESGLAIWKKILTKKLDRVRQKSRCFAAKIVKKVKDKFSNRKLHYRGKRKRPLKECEEQREHLYGFRVKIKLVENQQCTLGVTCTEDGQKINRFSHRNDRQTLNRQKLDRLFLDRQDGESFLSAAPVDCRTTSCSKK